MFGLSGSVFLEKEFFLLIVFSVIVPMALYHVVWLKQTISKAALLLFGVALVILARIDIFLIENPGGFSKKTRPPWPMTWFLTPNCQSPFT
jgi:hypothetical protein